MKFWTLFWTYFLVIRCSSSNKFESGKSKFFSSDDKSTVTGGGNNSDGELVDAFDNLHVDEKVSRLQRENHLSQQKTSANAARPLSCIDGSGKEVDWWFLYKPKGSIQYLYYSSLDVEYGLKGFLPLDAKFVINDIESSPVLKTIYHPDNSAESSEVWLGWNDEPEHEETENPKVGKKEKKEHKDAYGGNVDGVKHAHSKGFYAQNAVYTNTNQVTIGSYLMMTSLPRFPRAFSSTNKLYGDAIRNVLPRNPADIFDSNLSSKAQHFFCMSLPRETVNLEKNHNEYEVPINFSSAHVKFLHKYLKTIHPAIMATNYSDHKPSHWLWRRYFSLFHYPTEQALDLLSSPDINEKAMAYSKDNLPSFYYLTPPEHFQHVFPLTWSNFYFSEQGTIEYNPNRDFYRWEARFSTQNGCKTGNESECLASFSTLTTGLQSQIPLTFFAKHGLVNMDLYDDWAALHVAETQKNVENYYAGKVVDRYGLLVQSWIDSRTALTRITDKKIYDKNGELVATVHIDNVSHSYFPVKNSEPIRFDSNHLDHSKLAISFAMETLNTNDETLKDSQNSFVPSVFVADLNRTFTQARLTGNKQGRGGGAVVTESINLWRCLMKLNPCAGSPERFANSSITDSRKIQERLREHTNLNVSFSSLPVEPLRPTFLKSMNLSEKESNQKTLKALDFVPFLNELSEFVKKSENRPEHVSFMAFGEMIKAFAKGQVKGQAEAAWKKAVKENEAHEDAEYSCLIEWPEILTIPSLHLHREIPRDHEFEDEYLKRIELESQAPHIVKDSNGQLIRGDGIDSFIAKIRKTPRHKETQTDPVQTVDVGTSTETVKQVNTANSTELVTQDAGTSSDSTTSNDKTTNDTINDNLDDEKLFDLKCSPKNVDFIANLEDNYSSDDDIPDFNRQQYVDEEEEGGSDSDYSNREIDYDDDDDDDDDFDEDKFDPYEHFYDKGDDEGSDE